MAEEAIRGRYRLEQTLGRGGMSEVWLATDLELDRPVALKLLAPNADRQRFEREARAAATLSHPNINQLYDFGETEGRPFMVLEYLSGGTLEDQLDGRPLPDAQTARVARDLADGLSHAHARGLVHRDLKPANVLFDGEGRAKIADFGIAHLGDAGTLTEAGTVLGTAAYISPEQAAGETATPASDVYSFGVILFRMLTGRLPFESEQPMELVALHRDSTPPAIGELRQDAPPRLESLATAAMAKDPGDRPPDGAALLAELHDVDPADTTQLLGGARPARPPRRATGRRRRAPLVAVLVALALAAGLALAFVATRSDSHPLTTTATTTARTTTTSTSVETSAPATTAPARTTTTTTKTATTARPTRTRETSTFETVTTETPPPTSTAVTVTVPTTVPSTTLAP